MDAGSYSDAEVTVLRTAQDVWRAAADEFERCAIDCVDRQGSFAVCLSGGSTPQKFHALIADDEANGVRRLPWDKIHVFLGDERVVPPDHPDSNYRAAWESMLARVPIPESNIHRVRTELGPEGAAKEYENEIRQHFSGADVPRFDLIFLGLGTDGHTASLFPGIEALREQKRLVVVTRTDTAPHPRVTLTFPVLNHAAHVVFVVTGSEKATVLYEVLAEGSSSATYPAQQVKPVAGTLRWIVDQEAARLLPRGSWSDVAD